MTNRRREVQQALNAIVSAASDFASDDGADELEVAATPSLRAWREALQHLDELSARDALVVLLQHPSPWARLLAAAGLLESAPALAVRSLEELHAHETGPVELHAHRTLQTWRNGELHVW